MTLDIWLFLSLFVIVLLPEPFLLKKFQKQYGSPWGKESFGAFKFFDTVWIVVCIVGLGWSLATTKNDSSSRLVLLSIFMALISMPIALYSGFTGIYPQRSRIGYYYFQQYKDPARQFLRQSKYPEIKILGWVQLGCLIGIVVVSFGNLF